MHNNKRRTRGQALVEFALAAILIFFLLSAAIDLGLIFFRHQGLYNASLEGAQYGSSYTKTFTGAELIAKYGNDDEALQRVGCYESTIKPSGQYICLDEDAIRGRLVDEAGDNGGMNLVNMKDLDGNGEPDDANLRNDYIEVYAVNKENITTPDDPSVACPSIANPPEDVCYVYVRVKSDYNMFFVLAPAFGNKVDISAYTIFPIRSGVFQPGAPAETAVISTIPPTNTPTNTPTPSNTPTYTASPVLPTNTLGPSATRTSTSATATPTGPTNTRTRTSTRTPSLTPSQTLTPSKTLTPSQTLTPSKTLTPSRTSTPSVTRTASSTRTRTLTPSRTVSPTPSETRTQTLTPTKTNTVPPPTVTLTPSNTRTPTRTPTPAPPTRTATTEGT